MYTHETKMEDNMFESNLVTVFTLITQYAFCGTKTGTNLV